PVETGGAGVTAQRDTRDRTVVSADRRPDTGHAGRGFAAVDGETVAPPDPVEFLMQRREIGHRALGAAGQARTVQAVDGFRKNPGQYRFSTGGRVGRYPAAHPRGDGGGE